MLPYVNTSALAVSTSYSLQRATLPNTRLRTAAHTRACAHASTAFNDTKNHFLACGRRLQRIPHAWLANPAGLRPHEPRGGHHHTQRLAGVGPCHPTNMNVPAMHSKHVTTCH